MRSGKQRPRLALTINYQPVENRRQLVGALVSAKAPRRSTEASPQYAFRQMPSDKGRATGRRPKTQRHKERK